MSEIYCKNCKFHKTQFVDLFGIYNHQCFAKVKKRLNQIGNIDYDYYDVSNCLEKNKNKNCEDYARKWWKFWIKED